MHKLILPSALLVLTVSATKQNNLPDLTKKEDLTALGFGRIIEKDNSIIKKIKLEAIKEYWIEYIKDNSLHDKPMEKISRIEFYDSKWGSLKIEFPDNKPKIIWITY